MTSPISKLQLSLFPVRRHSALHQLILLGTALALSSAAIAGTNQWTLGDEPAAGAHVSALALDQTVPTTIYVSVGEKVYLSNNSGKSWRLSSYFDETFSQTVASVLVDPVNHAYVYAATSGGIINTNDGGNGWARVNPTIGYTSLAATPITTTGTFPTVYAGSSGNGVYQSVNGGGAWAQTAGQPGAAGSPARVISALAVDPITPATLYAGTAGSGIYRSVNSAAAWSALNNGLTGNALRINSIANDPITSGTLYIGTAGSGVYKYIDQAITFPKTALGFAPTSVTVNNQALNTASAAQVVTLTNNSSATIAFTSASVGTGFSIDQATTTCVATLAPAASCNVGVIFTPTTDTVHSSTLSIASNAPGSPHTINLVGTGPTVNTPALRPSALTLTSFNSTVIGVPTASQAVTLTNDGTSNLTITALAASGDFSIASHNCGGGVLPATVGATASCTANIVFTPSASGSRSGNLTITSDSPNNPGTVLLGNAASWQAMNSGLGVNLNVKSLIIDPVTTTTLYAGTAGGGVFKSTDGGTSWSEMNTGIPNKFITALILAPLTQQKLYAVSDAGLLAYDITNSPGLILNPPTVSGVAGTSFFSATGAGSISTPNPITLTNIGTLPLNFSLDISGEFSIVTNTSTCVSPLAAGANCVVNVTFNPATYDSNPSTMAANNAKTGALTINSDATGSPHSVNLKGTAAPSGTSTGTTTTPNVSLSPGTLTFTAVAVGDTSTSQPITLTNTGNATLNIASVITDGDFLYSSGCGTTLAPGIKCTITITFAPTGPGDRNGSLYLYSDATGSPHTVTLEGSGTSGATSGGTAVTISPTELEFPVQAVGVSSTQQTVTLTNTGTAALKITSVFADGDFAFIAASAANRCGETLSAGAKCVLGVVFTPTGGGDRAGTLFVYSDATGSPHTASLKGSGTTSITLTPTSLDFGSQPNGQLSAAKTITLKNTGPVPLNIESTGIIGQGFYVPTSSTTSTGSSTGYTTIVIDDFVVNSTTCESVLMPSASCTIDVAFFPRRDTLTGGSYTDTKNKLAVSNDAAGSPHKVLLTGRILPSSAANNGAASVSVIPSTLAFGTQQVALTSSPRLVTITNVGNSALNISNIIADGDFAYTTTCGTPPATLAAGKKCSISVTFTPTGTEDRSGKLYIYSDADGSPHSVTLGGSGSTLAPSVVLSVVPSSIDFSVVNVNTASAPSAVTITNKGTAVVTFSDLTMDGDFSKAASSTCGATPLYPGASCTFDIVFTPSAEGEATGTLTFSSDATSETYTIDLSGTGGDQMSFSSQSYGNSSGLTITARLHVAKRDSGKYGKVYLAALVGGSQLFFHNGYQWVSYSGDSRGPYPSYSYGQLTSKNIPVISNMNVTAIPGTVVYLGYGVVGFIPTEEDMFNYNKFGQIYVIP